MIGQHIPHVVMFAVAIVANAAMAHEVHASKKTFAPAIVEETAFGRAGDPRKVTRTIRVRVSDAMRFTPSEFTVKPNQTVRFVISNSGQVPHEMVIGTAEELKKHAELMRKFPEMEHDEAYIAHVKPGKAGEIVWQFTKPGEYRFACLVAGHFDAGMVGKLVVR